MKDYNFFEYYFEKKQEKNLKYLYFSAFFLVIISTIGSTYGWSIFQIYKLQQDIARQNANIDTNKIAQQQNQINSMKKDLEILNKYNEGVKLVEGFIGTDIIDSELLKKVSDIIPKEVTLNSMDINKQQLNIEGNAFDRVKVAELEHNLKKLNIFKTVHVNYVNDDNTQKQSIENKVNGTITSNQENILEEVPSNNTVQNIVKGYSFTVECSF